MDTLPDALATVRRATQWKIADGLLPGTEDRYYVDFTFRLDTTQLPGPLQLGVEGQPEWNLFVERVMPLPEQLLR